LGSPEVDLLGVTTVYGDVELRARLVHGFAALAGRRLTVWPGVSQPLSGRPVWVSGDEGKHFAEALREPARSLHDHRGLHDHGGLEIVAIGPLSNLAQAVRTDPGFAGRVRRVWMMGGNVGDTRAAEPPEHNFGSDAVAADEVFRAGLPITLLGVEVTRRLRLEEAEIAELGTYGPLGRQLERETRAWTAYWNEPYDVPHDAVTVIRMLRPDLFTETVRRLRIAPDGRVEDDATGAPVTVVTDLDIPAVRREIMDRIRAAEHDPNLEENDA
jgi:purine nucleosidase